MAAAPGIKVFNAAGEYVAATKRYEEAACLLAFLGDGASVRAGHAKSSTLYVEGVTGKAGESYDVAAETMRERERQLAFKGVNQGEVRS